MVSMAGRRRRMTLSDIKGTDGKPGENTRAARLQRLQHLQSARDAGQAMSEQDRDWMDAVERDKLTPLGEEYEPWPI